MVSFNFSFAPGTSLQQMIGFEMAGRVWSSFLSDPITVNIHVGVSSDLPTNVIGGALPGIRASQSYKEVVRGLESDSTSAFDAIAVDHLSTKSDYEAWFDEFDRKNGKNAGEKAKTREISLTRANARAMGIFNGSSNELDGVIVFGGLAGTNFRWSYDFTRSSSASANTLDFLSTAIHEIGHILGFVSGVDKPGWLNSRSPDKEGMERYKASLANRIGYTTPLDLFRFSTVAGEKINDLSYGSFGSDKFFSIDGGKTAIAQFSTGLDRELGGDGFQASHWKSGGTRAGIMAPSLTPQERPWISSLDLMAMDVMGWNLRSGVTHLNVDLSALRSQAEQRLAQRLGVSVSWLSQNAEVAAQQLGRDRSGDIDDMIRKSEVYEWGTRPGGFTPINPWRQVIELFQQRVVYASFATLDSEFSAMIEPQSSGGSESGKTLPLSTFIDSKQVEQIEIEIPKLKATAIPVLEAFTVAFESVSPVITPGQIDVSKWLERFERRSPGHLESLDLQEQNGSKKKRDWEIREWSSL